MTRTGTLPRGAKARTDRSKLRQSWLLPGLTAAILAAALTWSYWPVVLSLFRNLRNDPNYSVGLLVPFAAIYLLWNDREELAKLRPTPCWWGVLLILVAQAGRAFGLLWLYESAERYAFVLTIFGLVLLVGGTQIFRRTFWILAFLGLMVPLPGAISNRISAPLQSTAAAGTVFILELAGMSVSREGNVMVLNHDIELGVAEACSGLRMLTAFIVVAYVLAYIVNRPNWQKVVLVASSIPIAIVCNMLRVVVTAVLYVSTSSATAEKFFHDFAGVVMMPAAILLLLGELWLMNVLVIRDDQKD